MDFWKSLLSRARRGAKTDFGLVIDWKFHAENRWCVALTPYLIEAIIKEFSPLIISSQKDYDRNKKRLKYIVSAEPGWAAPRLEFDAKQDCRKAVFYSDPHFDTKRRLDYLNDNGFDLVFSYYKSPFFFHFKNFPEERFVHMPWAIPDEFVGQSPITARNDVVAIFGGRQSPAYDVRNWCRTQEGVTNYDFSGVENKALVGRGYFQWLAGFDAVVAAGSSDPIYDLVTPKYFEVASAGCLLIGQRCKDLETLGFNEKNMVIFDKENFAEKLGDYKKNPEAYLDIRKAGRELIRQRHTVSVRIGQIKKALYGNSRQ